MQAPKNLAKELDYSTEACITYFLKTLKEVNTQSEVEVYEALERASIYCK